MSWSSDALTSSTRLRGGEAVDVGHAQVEQHDVGPHARDGVECGLSAVRLADELEAGVDPHGAAHAAPEDRAVVDDQDADGAGAAGCLR